MKILLIAYNWPGGTQEFCSRAFTKLGHQIEKILTPRVWKPFLFYPRIFNQIYRINRWYEKKYWQHFNKLITECAKSFKPELVFIINEAFVYPETLSFLRERLKIPIAVWIADNPFDSDRFKFLPVNLRYFTHIFVGEPHWIPNIRMLAKTKVIEYLYGAYDEDIFKPVPVSSQQKMIFSANVSYAGSAYGVKAEAMYRLAILDGVADLGLKIWGWGGWNECYRYFPNIEKAYQKKSLTLKEMNIMNQVSKIVLNISHPQCISAFQQRTFEIPASGGFQIADHRSEIDRVLPEFEIDQFSTIEELRELIKYYLEHPEIREEKVKKIQSAIKEKHTYSHRMSFVIKTVFG